MGMVQDFKEPKSPKVKKTEAFFNNTKDALEENQICCELQSCAVSQNLLQPSARSQNLLQPSDGSQNLLQPYEGSQNLLQPCAGSKNLLLPSAGSQHFHFDFFLEETYSTKFVEFPKILTLQFGQREVKRLRFFVDLWEVQKVVQPMGLHNIFQVVECSKKKRPLPMDLIKTITKVSI